MGNLPLYYKLLLRGINARQMVGFCLANLLGMTIVLTAVQFWQDVKPMFEGSDSFLRPGQMVLSKHIDDSKLVSSGNNAFTQSEIDDLRAQPFTEDLAVFTPSRFSVYAVIGLQDLGMRMSTDMFLESVPDKYVDVNSSEWRKYDEDSEVPIILPQNYLNLYNFGFAATKGLPSISKKTVGMIPIELRLDGEQGTNRVTGRVVGFSKHINTILVPQSWLDKQNAELAGNQSDAGPSRIILQVTDISDGAILDYLESHGIETEQGNDDAAKTTSFMRTISVIVIAIGIVITLLAFYVLLLSIFILLQKHTQKIDNLLMMGYTISQVVKPFAMIALAMALLSLIISIPLMAYARTLYIYKFGSLYENMPSITLLTTIVVGIGITLVLSVINIFTIKRKVREVFDMHKA